MLDRYAVHSLADSLAFIEKLSDGELRARLVQHGIHDGLADNLISEREDDGARHRIACILEDDDR